jgi:hypothetical protein
MRTQLAEASALLLRAEEEARLAEQRRAGLIEVRDQLNSILTQQSGASGGAPGAIGMSGVGPQAGAQAAGADVSGLAAIARQAADNPRHIDYVMQLASHAGEIANALQARQATPTAGASGASAQLLAQLDALRARVDELIG